MNAKLTLNPARTSPAHALPALYYSARTGSVVLFDQPRSGFYVVLGTATGHQVGARVDALISCENVHWRRLESGEKVELSND